MAIALQAAGPASVEDEDHLPSPGISRRVLIAVLAIGMMMAGCTSSSTNDSDETAAAVAESAEGAARSDFKPTIRFAVPDWTGARLNVAIAEQLIERRLGYPVEAVEVTDTQRMLEQLEAGDLDAALEVWPSSLDDQNRDMLTSGRVEPLGELGVVGETGWFVPRYVVEASPDLVNWEPLASASVAADFATIETAPKGRFLGTDSNYEQFDEDIIAALDLPFEVVFSGSEQATTEELSDAAADNRPVLLFWWTPTAEIVEFDLVKVALPPRNADCEAGIEAGEPQSCDYPTDRLIKIVSPELAVVAPEVHRFLGSLTLTIDDQLQMIHQVEMQDRSVDDVAAGWLAANEDRWNSWFD